MHKSKKNRRTGFESSKSYEVPVEGSLGLLALGARGIIEWRKVRDAHNEDIARGKKNDD